MAKVAWQKKHIRNFVNNYKLGQSQIWKNIFPLELELIE